MTYATDTVGLLDHTKGDDLSNPSVRVANAWRAAFVRFGFSEYRYIDAAPIAVHKRYLAFHDGDAAQWILSRASGVSVIVVDASGAIWWVEYQKRVNERRDMMTLEVCRLVAYAYVNAIFLYVERQHRLLGSSDHLRNVAADSSFPGYCALRDYLAQDCDVPYRLACSVAFEIASKESKLAALLNRHCVGISRGEPGWL